MTFDDSDRDDQHEDIVMTLDDMYWKPEQYGFVRDPYLTRSLIHDTAVEMIDTDDFYENHLSDPALVTPGDETRYAAMLYKQARDKVYNLMAQDYLTDTQAERLF